MTLTRDFKETIRNRAARDPRFRKELHEALEAMLSGEIAVAKVSFLQHREGVRFKVKASA